MTGALITTLASVPRNEAVIRRFGPYPSLLDYGVGRVEVQRAIRRRGPGGTETTTQATLLALNELAAERLGGTRPAQFFDVGAHIGFHSLVVGSVYSPETVQVTGFEPTPETSAIMRSLASRNRLQIRIERLAVSDTDGTAEFYISPSELSNSLAEGFRDAVDTFEVPTIRLDRYCAERGVAPDVIKIDVETYETQVLAGAAETLRSAGPSIVCEVLKDTEPDSIRATVRILEAADYHLHRLDPETGWTACSGEELVEMRPHIGNDWLFTPGALDQRFTRAFDEWRAALQQCDERGNVLVSLDTIKLPPPRHTLDDANDEEAKPSPVRAGVAKMRRAARRWVPRLGTEH